MRAQREGPPLTATATSPCARSEALTSGKPSVYRSCEQSPLAAERPSLVSVQPTCQQTCGWPPSSPGPVRTGHPPCPCRLRSILSVLVLPQLPAGSDNSIPCLPPVGAMRWHSQAYPKALLQPEPHAPLDPLSCPGCPQPGCTSPLGSDTPPGLVIPPCHRLRLEVLSSRHILNLNPEKLPQGHSSDDLCFIAEKGWRGLVSWPRPLGLSDSSLIPMPQSRFITQEG